MLYTKKGDDGSTTLFGSAKRLKKNNAYFHALGTLDELNAFLGYLKIKYNKVTILNKKKLSNIIEDIQETLFTAQAEIAGSHHSVTADKIKQMEKLINNIENVLPPQKKFIISGQTELGSLLDYARAITRRGERWLIGIKLNQTTKAYLNRLSSLLFALARIVNQQTGQMEKNPRYK